MNKNKNIKIIKECLKNITDEQKQKKIEIFKKNIEKI